jgi:hypothetical protein
MSPERLHDMRAQSVSIRERWQTLLRIEPVSGPLANPDTLVHLIPEMLERVLVALAKPSRAPVSIVTARACVPKCNCGRNPYQTFFVAAEQALSEAVVLLEAALPAAERRSSDVAEVVFAIRKIARMEIDTFCGACLHRCIDPNCRHHEKPAPVANRVGTRPREHVTRA